MEKILSFKFYRWNNQNSDELKILLCGIEWQSWGWIAGPNFEFFPQNNLPRSFCAQIFKKFCLSIAALCILQSVSLSAQHAPTSRMVEEFMSDVLSGSAAPALNWTQDFSALALLTSWVAEFFVVVGVGWVGVVSRMVGYLAAFLASAYQLPVTPAPWVETTKNVSRHCQMFPGGEESAKLCLAEYQERSPHYTIMSFTVFPVQVSHPSPIPRYHTCGHSCLLSAGPLWVLCHELLPNLSQISPSGSSSSFRKWKVNIAVSVTNKIQ